MAMGEAVLAAALRREAVDRQMEASQLMQSAGDAQCHTYPRRSDTLELNPSEGTSTNRKV
jgi:hypothetical protein